MKRFLIHFVGWCGALVLIPVVCGVFVVCLLAWPEATAIGLGVLFVSLLALITSTFG